jgi:hypothetical protein
MKMKMIRQIPFILLAQLILFSTAQAQDIPNPGFETWSTQGNYEDPQGWGTLNSQTAILGIKTATKASAPADIHAGSYALKLSTSHIGAPYNMNIPGLAATGTINATTKAIDGGFSYNQRPISLSGWYKYIPAGKDTASVEVTLSKWDITTMKRVVVGHAKFLDTAHVTTYTSFTLPLSYTSAMLPDTGVIVLLSSQQNSSVVNSTLYIDALGFNLSSGIPELKAGAMIRAYPNPATDLLYISGLPAQASRLKVYALSGKILLDQRLSSASCSLPLDAFAPGMYFYEVLGEGNEVYKQAKFIISK